MKRAELAHLLRAAAEIAGDGEILVIGSQAVLAALPEDRLPARATMSMEADICFLDGDLDKSDRVEGAIGEGSHFHASFGYYAQGVALETAVLPEGWLDRAISVGWEDCGDATPLCLEVHDLVASKLVAGREKDIEFTEALLEAGVVEVSQLKDRIERLPVLPGQARRILATVIRIAQPTLGHREKS